MANKLWMFTSLQMGLSSSHRIYTHFADAIEYICCKENSNLCFMNGLQMLRHYIDDFFGVCKTKNEAEILFKALYKLFKELGVPTRQDKCQLLNTRNKILGWIYDTLDQTVSPPSKKRLLLLDMLDNILSNKSAAVKFLQQLIGRLQHCSQIIFPGKVFVRRLEALLHLSFLIQRIVNYLLICF